MATHNDSSSRGQGRACLDRLDLIALFLILLFPLQVLTATRHFSPTFDEGSKLASGWAYLVTGEYLIGLEHPPLGKILSAAPLLYVQKDHPAALAEFRDGESFIRPDQYLAPGSADLDRIFFWATVPSALIGLLLGLVVYLFVRRLFGAWAALAAVLFVTLDPLVLAFGGVVNNDLVVTFFMLACLFLTWRFLVQPTKRRLVLLGIVLGLSLASKFSAMILVPTILSVFFLSWLSNGKGGRFFGPIQRVVGEKSLLWYLRQTFWIGLLSALTLWGCYGFEISKLENCREAAQVIESEGFQAFSPEMQALFKQLPVPAEPLLRGLYRFLLHAGGSHQGYLMGSLSDEGWWYYFPLALLFKAPLPTLILLGIGLLFLLSGCWPSQWPFGRTTSRISTNWRGGRRKDIITWLIPI